MNYLYNTLESFVSKTVNLVSSLPWFNSSFIFVFLGFSKICSYYSIIINRNFKQLAKNYPKLYISGQSVINYLYQICERIHSLLYKYRLEPNEPTWLNTSQIEVVYPNINTSLYTYCETYDYINNHELSIDETPLQHFYTTISVELTKQFIKNKSNTNAQLFTLKYDNKYLYRLTQSNTNIQLNLSTVRFLSILYTHPKMEHPIHINIPKNWFLIGNEILSSIFILRYLQYQSSEFVFDYNYILQIIDNNINQFNMKCHQYILLEENEYKVLNLQA